MSFTYVLGKMLSLAVMMLVGFAVCRRGILDSKSNAALSELVVNVTTPCMMLASLSDAQAQRSDLLIMTAAGIVMCGLLIAAGESISRRLKCSSKEKTVFKYFTVFTNNGFMGFPVVRALWGSRALLYTALLNIPVSILMYSYGMRLYAKEAHEGTGSGPGIGQLINIPNVSAVMVLVLALCSFKFTGQVQETFETLGDATVPLSMIVIGSTLAEKPVGNLFADWKMYVLALLRLIAVPAVIFGLVYMLPIDPLIKGVLVVIAAMPGSASGVMFAQVYGTGREISSRYVFISTVMSVITIPVIVVMVLSPLGIG